MFMRAFSVRNIATREAKKGQRSRKDEKERERERERESGRNGMVRREERGELGVSDVLGSCYCGATSEDPFVNRTPS